MDVTEVSKIKVNYTGLTGQPGVYQTAWPLIVAVDNSTGVCTLSAPLAGPISSGASITLVTLKYHPFSPLVYSDNTTSPYAMETVEGWMTYVSSLFKIVRSILGTEGSEDSGFDAEVWNEYTFGSQFLNDQNYYNPYPGVRVPISYTNWNETRSSSPPSLSPSSLPAHSSLHPSLSFRLL